MPLGVNMSVALEICGVYQPRLTYCINQVVLDWRNMYVSCQTEQHMFWCDGLFLCCASVQVWNENTHTVYCFIVTQYYIATDGPHYLYTVCHSTHIKISLPYCSLSPELLVSQHFSLMADYNLPFFWPGQMMCHTVTLRFSAHVGNNLAVVIITHLPRSWESSAIYSS